MVVELLAETNDSPLSSAPNDSPRLELLEKSAQHALAADRTSEVETCSLSSAPDSGPRSELVEESVQMIAAARNVQHLAFWLHVESGQRLEERPASAEDDGLHWDLLSRAYFCKNAIFENLQMRKLCVQQQVLFRVYGRCPGGSELGP